MTDVLLRVVICLLGATLHAYNILFTTSAPAPESPYGQSPFTYQHNANTWGRSFYFQGRCTCLRCQIKAIHHL